MQDDKKEGSELGDQPQVAPVSVKKMIAPILVFALIGISAVLFFLRQTEKKEDLALAAIHRFSVLKQAGFEIILENKKAEIPHDLVTEWYGDQLASLGVKKVSVTYDIHYHAAAPTDWLWDSAKGVFHILVQTPEMTKITLKPGSLIVDSDQSSEENISAAREIALRGVLSFLEQSESNRTDERKTALREKYLRNLSEELSLEKIDLKFSDDADGEEKQ